MAHCIAVWAGPMLAQTGATATLLGAVTDPSGAVVAGAAVTATNSGDPPRPERRIG